MKNKSNNKLKFVFYIVFIIIILIIITITRFYTKLPKSQPDSSATLKVAELGSKTNTSSSASTSKSNDNNTTTTKTNDLSALSKSYLNKNVPFALQAPSANWDFVHEEACEETAILIAKEYFSGNFRDLDNNQNEQKIQEIIAWERGNFGYFEDTTLEKNQEILTKMFNIKSEIIENPQINDIKNILIQNNLVLVPTAGRLLRNPYFTGAGPIFHMVVIVGWDENNFIVHDVGTKRGKDYKYPYDVLLNANHDLYENAKFPLDADLIKTGSKKMLRVYK